MTGSLSLRWLALSALLGGWLTLFSSAATAVTVDRLYQVVLPSSEGDRQALDRQVAQGLWQVLERLVGDREQLQLSDPSWWADPTRRFLSSYAYRRQGNGQLELVLDFSESAIRQQLRRANLAAWSSNRPLVLTVLVVDRPQGRALLNEEFDAALIARLQQAAQRRAIPLQLPLWDLRDTLQLDAQRLWQSDRQAVHQLAQRYDVDALYYGRVSELSDGRWLGQWWLESDQGTESFELTAVNDQEYLQRSVDWLADHLALRYAVAPGQGGDGVTLRVDGVADIAACKHLLDHLEHLSGVSAVILEGVDGLAVSIRLIADADALQIERILALDDRFVAQDSTEWQDLHYRWQGELE